jgi:hypothetical protein
VTIVLVPSTIALLPEYAGIEDPVAELRSSCRQLVEELVDRHPERVAVVAAGSRAEDVARGVTVAAGERIARHLLDEAGFSGDVTGHPAPGEGVLVVANGSACRTEKAPGHLDERAAGFDNMIGSALRDGDGPVLRNLDARLGAELWCTDVPALRRLGALVEGPGRVAYDDAPYGVQYWVASWPCGS